MFVLKDLRRSQKTENMLVMQGWCDSAFSSVGELSLVLSFKDEEKEFPIRYQIDKLSPLNYFVTSTGYLAFIATIYINVNDEMKSIIKGEKGAFSLYLTKDTGEREELAKLLLEDVRGIYKHIPYSIDSVQKEENGISVSGWAMDINGVDVRVITASGQDLTNDPAVEMEIVHRQDVLDLLYEGYNHKDVGFILHVKKPAASQKLFLDLRAGKITEKVPIQFQTKHSKILFSAKKNTRKVIDNLKTIGFKGTMQKVKNKISRGHNKNFYEVDYDIWRNSHIVSKADLEKQKAESANFAYQPKFSILVPLYETPQKMLNALIQSVMEQSYPNWELVLSDGSRDASRLKGILQDFMSEDERIKYVAEAEGPLGISDNTNQALAAATGDYIVLGDHDDLFTPDALFETAKVLNENLAEMDRVVIQDTDLEKPSLADYQGKDLIDMIYTDEDKCDESGEKFSDPNMKPDFNPDYLNSTNYICHMLVARRSLVNEIGDFNKEFDGAQDYDFILRLSEKARAIYHIPKVLYHWRSSEASTATNPKAKMYAFESGRRAIEAHLARLGRKATVTMGEDLGSYDVHYEIEGNPLLSILIPNKDHIADLKTCMDAIDQKSTYKNIEYVIIENNSTEEETFAFYKELEKREDVQVVYYKGDFNFSKINNFGEKYAKGQYLLLLNNDTEMINPDSLKDMLGFCQQPEVGAVGARLYYEDDTLQHAGVVIGFGGIAGHCFVGLHERPGEIYFNRSKMSCDYTAVTAACLMVSKEIYEEVEGLEAEFKVAFNDIDFCMKIREAGYLVVYDAQSTWHHYESKSRGLEDTPEKENRFRKEIALFQDRWTYILEHGDPYYNENLSLTRQDFSLRV